MRVRTYGAGVALGLIVTLALVVSVVALPAAPALADHCSGEGRIDQRGGDVVGECHESTPGESGGGSVDALWDRYCAELGSFREGDDVTFHLVAPVHEDEIELLGLDPSGSYVWYDVVCWRDGVSDVDVQIIVAVTPPVAPEVIRDQAAARIEVPEPSPVLSPPLARQTFVRVATWLWLDGEYWEPIEVSETRGLVTVTVRATPMRADWLMGDGGGVTCLGPGVEWVSGLAEDASDCLYTYLHSSYGEQEGRFEASVTVTWEFEWWLNGVYRGVFGTVDVSSGFVVAVGEIQAIRTGG